MNKNIFHMASTRTAVLLALVAAIVLIGTPHLIKHLFQNWLLENGGEQVTVQDVDFNPFTGTLLLKNIHIIVNGKKTLASRSVHGSIRWLSLFKRRVELDSLLLRGVSLHIDNSEKTSLRLGGIEINLDAAESEPPSDHSVQSWTSGISSLILEKVDISYQDQNTTIDTAIETLRVEKLKQWHPNQSALIELVASINKAPVTLKAEIQPFANTPAFKGSLTVQDFAVDSLHSLLKEQFSELSGTFSTDSTFDIEGIESEIKVNHQGVIELDELRMVNTDIIFISKHLHWNGEGKLSSDIKTTSIHLNAKGVFSSSTSLVDISKPDIEWSHNQTTWNGSLLATKNNDELTLEMSADLDITDPDLTLLSKKARFGKAKTLTLSGIQMENIDSIGVKLIGLSEVAIGGLIQESDSLNKPAVLQIEKLNINKLQLKNNHLDIVSIEERNLNGEILRNKDGEFEAALIINLIKQLETPEKPQNDAKKEPSTPLEISVGKLTVSGNSQIRFVDTSVSPEFAKTIKIKKAELTDIDSKQPAQPSNFVLDASIDKHTQLTARATFKPFLQAPAFNLKGELRAMDLLDLSAYMQDSLGILPTSGSMDAKLSIKSEEQIMSGKIKLKLHQFELDTVESKNSLQSHLPVPLNVALDTLRDKHNNIELKIPIEGDAKNTEFNFNNAIQKALASGVSKGALAYLTVALQPYGALIVAAKYAGEAVTRLRLKPIEFQAKSVELDEKNKDYLKKIAGLLKDRPKVSVKICGIAVDADKPAKASTSANSLTKMQETLAQHRADAVKDYLVEHQNTPAGRLASCKPGVETDDTEAKPRVDLLI